ncbi:WG repeat-containing protein [Paractinoplanes atraurantiacus]|uniref:WG repeat-containing protein n=1 Tax=Paractinoplanes atraurantiacus TaxID=1036182 RepID=UPI001FE9C02F|nr:WG repeat-containing protein [Actinoplanes atraurantiacus]
MSAEFRQGGYYEPEPSYQPHPDQGITPGPDAAAYDRPEPVTAPPYLVADGNAGSAGTEHFDPSVSPISSLPADHPLPTGPVAGHRNEPVSAPQGAGLPVEEAPTTEGLPAETPAAGTPAVDAPVAEQPRGLGWLLSQSGLGAITPLPPPEPLLAMIEQPVAQPEPEEVRPVSAVPEKPNWFVQPADDELAEDATAAQDELQATSEQPEADQDTVAPSTPEQLPEEDSVVQPVLPEDSLEEPDAYAPSTDHTAAELQSHELPTDHPAPAPQDHQPIADHPVSEPQDHQLATDQPVSEPQDHEPSTDNWGAAEAYTHVPDQPAQDLDTHPVTESEVHQAAAGQTAADPRPAEDLDIYPATESEVHQAAADHTAAEPEAAEDLETHSAPESQAAQSAVEYPAVEPQAASAGVDLQAVESEADQPAVEHEATEPQEHQPAVAGPSAEQAAVEVQDAEPGAEQLVAEEWGAEQLPHQIQDAEPPAEREDAVDHSVDEPADQPERPVVEPEASEDHAHPADEFDAGEPDAGPDPAEEAGVSPHSVEAEQVEGMEPAFGEQASQVAEPALVEASVPDEPVVSAQDDGFGEVSSEPLRNEDPGNADEGAPEVEAPHIEIELGPEWAQVEDEAAPAVDELLEVAEAPSAEFGVAEPAGEEAVEEAVDVELLELAPEPVADEPVEEIVDVELVEDSRPELVAAVEDPEPAPDDPEPVDLTSGPAESEAEESAVEAETAEAEPEVVAAAPSVVAVPRVPAAPIRQRGDKVQPQDRRADPEQVLSAYPWVFDPATLRERIEETDPMGVVIDRLTDKLEYAERDSVRARLLSLRAVAERLLDELDPALEDAEAGLEHAKKAGDPVLEATVLGRLAHVRHWRGEYAEADRLYALASSPELPTRLQAELHELAGRSAFEQGRYLEAVNHFETALDLRKGTDPDLVERIELALDTITGLTTEGWGPYPRTPEEIGGERPAPGPSLFEDENGWGAVDEHGQVVVEAKYDRFADGFTAEGLAVVESDGKQGVIDRTGQVVLPLEHAEVRLHPAAFLVADKFGLWGALGRDGAPMIELTHSERADVIEEIERRVPATRPVL